jgi:hypothetical protein
MDKFLELEIRISNVISLPIFSKILEDGGEILMDFQCDWDKSNCFEELPELYQRAILAAEAELNGK